MSEVTELKLNDRAAEYSKQLQEAMTLGEKGAFEIDKDKSVEIFASQLPENITMKEVKEVQDASIDFGVANADALGHLSLKAMQEDEELESTSFTSRIEGNRYDSTYIRKREGVAMGKPWVKYGGMTQDMTQGSGRRGGLKSVIKHHSDLAASVFNK